jgi:predicted DNA-binding transcriptional regulator AlpA
MTSSPPILLDARQTAALLGISLRTFRERCKEPGFPAARSLGPRSTRWVRTELESYAVSLPTAPQDEPPQLTAARKARAARMPTANAPFPQGPALAGASRSWKQIS